MHRRMQVGLSNRVLIAAMAGVVLTCGGTAAASPHSGRGTSGPAAVPAAGPAAASIAPGAPGALSYFDEGRKDCVGTARNTASKVWFTVADGVLSDVYEPTIDNSNVQTLQYVVTDGHSFTDLQTRDTTYTVAADPTGMACTVTSTSAAHGYRLSTTYFTDPHRDTVLARTTFTGPAGLSVYARLDGHVNGNGGGGTDNAGADSGSVLGGVPVIGDTSTTSQATNRDYAVPTFMALDASTLGGASVGYAGSDSDGLSRLDSSHTLSPTSSSAPNGHIVATADVTPPPGSDAFTLALGFGRTGDAAVATAGATLAAGEPAVLRSYRNGWERYDAGLRRPSGPQATPARLRAYYLSANVIKSSEDKTFPGAIVASLASPWGQAVSAGTSAGGVAPYFGSYREVFSRDLYEATTGLLADGDVATARAATLFLFDRQQLADGRLPRNSLLNGESAPDTGGDQLDETAYPILMAYLSGLGHDRSLYRDHIVGAADFLVSHGPSFGNERWEEQSGYSPSTIAAEIAGLTAAAKIASNFGDTARARVYQAVADDFQRTVKGYTVTDNGPDSSEPYFLRLSKNGDPDSEYDYSLGNGSVTADQRSVVDGGFQDLVRLGELSPQDPDVVNSLEVVDSVIAANTPSGTGYYRYGTSTPGSEDGYGDCWTPDPTNCPADGQPWPTTDTGSGHLWPVLSGERAETALAQGDSTLAASQLAFMMNSASGEGLVPEQVWEDPDVAAAPTGTDPTTASIGFTDGQAAGSASPLTWAQAQELRLITDVSAGRIVDRPSITIARYVTHPPPADVPITLSAPAAGQTASATIEVRGITAPHAAVVVASSGLDVPGSGAPVSTTAGRTGAFTLTVPVAFGDDAITATATTAQGTGVARVSVSGELSGATALLDVTDPTGDDDGPGTYQYPTASDFTAGSFDITRFQVSTKDGQVYLQTTLRTLNPTFGDPLGAQLFDLYVHRSDAAQTSTAPAAPSRNYSIAAQDAWSQRLKVQGFAAPVWVDAGGSTVGSVTAVVVSDTTRTVTIVVPQAQFGTPTSGWTFTEALTGQDGYGVDNARVFTPTPTGYTFGVCAVGNTAPICGLDPNTVPKVMDTVVPPGIDQATELDPTAGPVVLHGVAISDVGA